MEPKHVIALEIGSSKIRGAAGTVDENGILTVIALEEERLIDCVRYGWIRNVEEVDSRIHRIIKKLENRLHPRKIKSVYLGIGGLSFMSSPREVCRRLPAPEEFTEDILADLRQEAFNLPVGDREVVDVIGRQFYIDRTPENQPIGVYGQDIKAEFNIVTCRPLPKQVVNRVVSERLRLGINDFIVRQIAEGDLVITNEEKMLGCVLVDFGAETTGVSVYKSGHLQYFATLPLGSRNITLDITALNCLEEKAEEYKKIGGNAMGERQTSSLIPDSANYDEINSYVGARAGEIIANINEQIKYAGYSPSQLPAGIIIVGAGAKLSRFNERLETETKLPVRLGTPLDSIRFLDGRIQGPDAVDVISVLYAAAKRGARECMEKPQPAVTQQQPPVQSQQSPVQQTQSPAPEPEPEPVAVEEEERPRRPKPGRRLFSRIKDFTSNFLNDDPYDDDFDDQK